MVFGIWGAWNLGLKAGIAAEEAGGNFWKDGFWKGALVGFAAGALGGSGLAPLGTEWLGTTIWGAGLGTATQAGGIWAMGGEDYSQIWQGALIGGAMGFMASEQFGNLTGGKGFYSNDQVLNNFEVGKYDIAGFDSWQDAALDYYGFEGKYDPNSGHFSTTKPEPGFTNKTTGEISYSEEAFSHNFDKLYATYDHEIAHRLDVLSSKPITTSSTEYGAYLKNFRNQGLYKDHGYTNWVSKINHHGANLQMEKFLQAEAWKPNFLHRIFRIRKLW